MHSRQQPFRFFDLPPELREKILSYCLVLSEPIDFDGIPGPGILKLNDERQDESPESDASGGLLAIFLVNSAMYQEASGLFYSQNHFRLNLSPRVPLSFRGDAGFLSPTQGPRRRRVRTLEFHIVRVGTEFQHHIAPALSEMALAGCLRNLSVYFHGGKSTSSDKIAFENRFRSPAYQLLWNLLADPYLDNVHLFAYAHHARQLYDAFGKWILLGQDGAAAPKMTDSDEDECVKLDHKALVRAYSSEPEILRVGERLPTY